MTNVIREEVIIGPDTEFHMLRHLSAVDPIMLASIREKGHSENEIQLMVKSPGSRFHASFADSIEKLLKILFRHPFQTAVGMGGNLELEWSLQEGKYPSGVGTASLASLGTLSETQRKACYRKHNRGMELRHLDVDSLPATWDCCMILKRISAGFLVITAFPGKAALPLPHAGMKEDEQSKCKEFWERQVFLVLSE